MPLRVTLNVNGRDDVANEHYGYATAKNGATVQTLLPLTEDDLVLDAGESVKLLFPGVQGKHYTLNGKFEGADDSTQISYTINGGAAQTNTGAAVSIAKNLKNDYTTEEIVFGDPLPICKIGTETFPTLKAAVQYMVNHKNEGTAYKVEMLVDYLIPASDVMEIPSGFQVTFTTSQDEDFRGSNQVGTDESGNVLKKRAILSRDVGNTGASVKATGAKGEGSTLTVTDLIFDGRSIAGAGNGGAVSAHRYDVSIDNCEFKGYTAVRGGAIFTSWGSTEKIIDGTMDGRLEINNTVFTNCKTNASVDKAGGGAIMTTTKNLVMTNCTLTNCSVEKAGHSQGGAVFHNITDDNLNNALGNDNDYSNQDYSNNTTTRLENCRFFNCYSKGWAGGAVETDAMHTFVKDCEFHDAYTNGDSGGGLLVYARNREKGTESDFPSYMTVENCLFENCKAEGTGIATGGAGIRTTAVHSTIKDTVFKNCVTSKMGGGISGSNDNAKSLTIIGCTFEDCRAEGDDPNNNNGGAVEYKGLNLYINTDAADEGGDQYKDKKTTFTNCTANSGGGLYHSKDGGEAKIANIECDSCVARTGQGGGLYTNALNLTVSGDDTSFTDCTAQTDGGGLYHPKDGGEAKIENIKCDSCVARTGQGGGLYTNTFSLTVSGEYTRFKDCTAQTDGGGLYHNRDANGSKAWIIGGSFENCAVNEKRGGAFYTPAKDVKLENLTVSGNKAITEGGGIWINPSNNTAVTNCKFTGNTVTGSTGKGGGVYVGGNKSRIDYSNSEIDQCSAVEGGGWYQDKGILYIYSGLIDGDATSNGGGIATKKNGNSDNEIYHYGGTIKGSAGQNGGGVYLPAGQYHIGDNDGYTGATVGTIETDQNGNDIFTATAGNNGGGLYVDSGNFYVYPGASICGQAGNNGGGVYDNDGTTQTGGNITSEG